MWTWWELNPQPLPCKGSVLAIELQAQKIIQKFKLQFKIKNFLTFDLMLPALS